MFSFLLCEALAVIKLVSLFEFLVPDHLQNSPLMQTRRRAFVAEDSDDNSDDDTITSGARCQPFEKSQLASKSVCSC